MLKFKRLLSSVSEDGVYFFIELEDNLGGLHQIRTTPEDYDKLLGIVSVAEEVSQTEKEPVREKKSDSFVENLETQVPKQGDYEDDEGLESI